MGGSIGVARIFDWGGTLQITWNDVIKNFPKRGFWWDKNLVDWKVRRSGLIIENCGLNRDFAKGSRVGFKSKVKK